MLLMKLMRSLISLNKDLMIIMDNFYVITNELKDRDHAITDRVVGCLKRLGKHVYTDLAPDNTECVIALGGDGTLIQAARDMADRDVTFVGVNMGTLGFLTDVDPSSIEDTIEKLVRGEYVIEERMMLYNLMNGTDEYWSLNDVVVTRSGPIQIIEYRIYVNDRLLSTFRADGVLVSTPTGSTGYNLSAGGPIISPMSDIMVVTPICAHTLNSRSIILPGSDRVRIEASWRGEEGCANLSFDGEENIPLKMGDYVTVTKSTKTTKIIRFNQESFVTALSRKLI